MNNQIEMSTETLKITIQFADKPTENYLNVMSAIMRATMNDEELSMFVNKCQDSLNGLTK